MWCFEYQPFDYFIGRLINNNNKLNYAIIEMK